MSEPGKIFQHGSRWLKADKEFKYEGEKNEFIKGYSWIKSIAFKGGLLGGTKINLSPELNNFIGIRGSGKSAIIEILRYSLGINLGNQAADQDYKNGLIEHVVGSGGKITLTLINKDKEEYCIEKIYGQKEDIYKNGKRLDISINAILEQPVYFGQKDLSNKDIDFEADLVHKLIGNHVQDIKREIESKKTEISTIINSLNSLENLEELKKETNEQIKDAEYKLKQFKDKGIEEKLREQADFDSDITCLQDMKNSIADFAEKISSLIEDHEPFFDESEFESQQNKEFFEQAEKVFDKFKNEYKKFYEIKTNTEKYSAEFNAVLSEIKQIKERLKQEFARIKRQIDIPNLNPDDFLKINRQLEISKLKIKEIEKSENHRREYITVLNDKITELNNLWDKEFKILETHVKKINQTKSFLVIDIEYKDRKDKFLDKLKQTFKGTSISETNYKKISDNYQDFIEIYRNIESLKHILNDNHYNAFKTRFDERIAELLCFKVENKFTIKYNNRPLNEHSLGQRATGLILFLLAQQQTDILIIDQPEDDLDNQTIYEDVIKRLKALKANMQFIFATHNANIPVLGDSEKVIACTFYKDKIDIHEGNIDNRETQKKIIEIMEGGQEAFNRRRDIYKAWRVKNEST